MKIWHLSVTATVLFQEENREMVERLMKYKSKDAEKMNEENENFVRKKHAKLQIEFGI